VDISDIEKFIKTRVASGQYQSRLHALQRVNERGILPHEVREALLTCKVIEDYPADRRGTAALYGELPLWGKIFMQYAGYQRTWSGLSQYTNPTRRTGKHLKRGGSRNEMF